MLLIMPTLVKTLSRAYPTNTGCKADETPIHYTHPISLRQKDVFGRSEKISEPWEDLHVHGPGENMLNAEYP